MKDLLGTYDLVQNLYQQGCTNNEQLQQLLVMLKEISDARPSDISEDFKKLFADLELSESTLNDTNTMTMMFLTKLAMSYKPTNSSELPHRLLAIHSATLGITNKILNDKKDKLRDIYLAKMEGNADRYDELTNMLVYEMFHSTEASCSEIRFLIDEWLKEIRY